MNTLLNRFFSSNEANQLSQELSNDPRKAILDHLYNLTSSSIHLSELEAYLSEVDFDDDPFFADVQLAEYYLELENYLIIKDPRYVGSATDLQQSIRSRFPEFTHSDAFNVFIASEADQGVLLARLYLLYLLKQMQRELSGNQLITNWLDRVSIRFPEPKALTVVERINLLRKLKETSAEMYQDMVKLMGAKTTLRLYRESFQKFESSYKYLKSTSIVEEVIPSEEINTVVAPVRMLRAVKDGDEASSLNHLTTAQYNSIIENLLDGYLLLDRELQILDANNTAIQILGLRPSEVNSYSMKQFLPEEISRGLLHDIGRVDTSIPSVVIGKRIESIITNSKGIQEDYEIAVTNNYIDERESYSVVLKNISNKKHMLDAIREAKVHAERTAQAKSTFLSNMSHEIRTPLNVILGLSDIIRKEISGENQSLIKNIEGIDFSAKSLLSIVNDILDFSKIEAGKLTLQSIDFNLRKVVESLSDGFEIKAREKGLELILKMDSNIPDILIGDQYRLNQILNNLIGNAIKFTKHGHVAIQVRTVSQSEDEIKLQFKVSDTGIGISEENLKKIFDSFYQVDKREASDIAGTGLGLAITKELIQLQNGEFNAVSELDKGSVFDFTLPFKRSKLKGLNENTKTYVRQDKNLEGLKVLVAEDNKMNQFYIRQLLSKMKVTADIAENGQEAVEIFEQNRSHYDLILMDMHMPVMNGIEAITTIRKSNKESIKKVPIVACSADVFPEARKSAIKAGVDFYLTKPVSEEAIKEVLFWLISDEEFDPQLSTEKSANTSSNDEEKRMVDINQLKETFDNDEEFIASLLEVFIETTPEDYKSMRNCIDREYYSRASSLAHKMKSSFMNLGMTVHGHHLQQIESHIIKPDGIEEARKHFKAFSQMYTKALLEVNLLLIELKHK